MTRRGSSARWWVLACLSVCTVGKARTRSLQQTVDALAPASIVRVSTAEELRDSVRQRAQDIVIENHIDLTDLPLQDFNICPVGCANPIGVVHARSIRGNCSADLPVPQSPGSLGFDIRPGQCVLFARSDLFTVLSPQIWIHRLYLRISFPTTVQGRRWIFASMISIPPNMQALQGERYVTQVTCEGDGLGPGGGIWADSDVYVADSVFGQLGGGGIGVCSACSAAVLARAHVAVHNCTFSSLVPGATSGYIKAMDAGSAAVTATRFAAAPAPLHVEINAALYSDDSSLVVTAANGVTEPPQPLTSIPEPPQEGERFLAASDAWFVALRLILEGGAVPAGPSKGSKSGTKLAVILAVLSAMIIVAAAAAAAVVLLRRRRRAAAKRRAHTGQLADVLMDGSTSSKPGKGGRMPGSACPPSSSLGAAPDRAACSAQSSLRNTQLTSLQSSRHSSLQSQQSGGGTLQGTGTLPGSLSAQHSLQASSAGRSQSLRTQHSAPATNEPLTLTTERFTAASMTPPTSDAPVATRLKYLHHQLNSFGADSVLLHGYKVLGELDRRQGGQGVVVFVVGERDKLAYAVKFFVSREAFLTERQLYESRTLGPLLPRVHDVYDPEETPARLLDRCGRPLPPCIVMERGESLTEWSRRAKPDVFQAVAVLAHVAERLRDMHQAQLVHRDIKPSNIMMLPRENRWTVIDFGTVAAIGVAAPLACTIMYSPPEVVDALEAGVRAVVADPATDAWALGVVAFEVLTGCPTFDVLTEGKAAVMQQLRGEVELPWEGERFRAHPTARRRLGVFRQPVLALLARAPAQRASMAQFCDSCHRLFTSPTTVENG
eukprot:jgi/Ulvmu1/12561/UM091_0002.1